MHTKPSYEELENKIKELEHKNNLLSNLSITDHLTGLHNRRYFQSVIEDKVKLLSRFKHQFYLALIAIDFFKDYNDSYGHHKGDIALQKIADTLKEALNRKTDYVFRVGGEEFGILFEVDEIENANLLMESVRKKVEDLKIVSCNSVVCNFVTISIGLGYIKKVKTDTDAEFIYDEVDKLLYKSKDDGRNRITFKEIIV